MMSESKTDNQAVLKSLRYSVAKALERKRRLGQYAIVSKMVSSLASNPKKSNRSLPPKIRHLTTPSR